MVIWLNGAFGSGKTQTAFELNRRIENSFVYDPENVGFMIRKNQPQSLQKPDFQDEVLWRSVNFELLKQLCAEYDGTVIVPMTLTEPKYYDEIITPLRSIGIDVRHFVLWAEPETLKKRLRSRFEGQNSWAAQQIPRCVDAFENARFEGRIVTDNLTVSKVAEAVASYCGIGLAPADTGFRMLMNRIRTQLGAIR